MRPLAFDTETEAIEPGVIAPRLVCMTLADGKSKPQIIGRRQAVGTFLKYANAGYTFVGHNVAFDFCVLCTEDPDLIPLVFQLYRDDRVYCTQTREMLIAIREGDLKLRRYRKEFNLGFLAKKYLRMDLDKSADSWRLRYGELLFIPVANWPEPAKQYALLDAVSTLGVFKKQARRVPDVKGYGVSPDEFRQHRAAWVLHLMRAWGMRLDSDRVIALKARLQKDWLAAQERMMKAGFMRVAGTKAKPKISRNMAVIASAVRMAYVRQGLHPPLTDGGKVQTSKQALKGTNDPVLEDLANALDGASPLTKFLPALEKCLDVGIVNPGFNVLVDNGRTSSFEPNFQNLPRAPGVRECIKARPGTYLCSVDYDGAELCSLAQVCTDLVGYSHLAEALRKGFNPHVGLFAKLRGVSYKKALRMKAKAHRQWLADNKLVKAANFGYPGGLGAEAFIGFAKSYDPDNPILLTLEQSQVIRQTWFEQWPEMRSYFEMISDITSDFGPGYMTNHISGRVRGQISFTEAANGFFSGLTADGAKEALFNVAEVMYVDRNSPLYGSRMVNYIHDEVIAELPIDGAHDAAIELARIMCESMARFITCVPITATPALMSRWYKNASAVYDSKGRLKPWEPS